ncbi:hypothetical protein CRENPOLYSF1_140019 [Crenothrix polyspora]|uniref:Uncharacterized protein n=1 Tax=Crenothrix polyspora TaxID=360316 RepID=A0A1R4H1Z4_9GAMM|nr:hypothetical protein CRENPOLYSF1_140019 [Crenothrix polyspora]
MYKTCYKDSSVYWNIAYLFHGFYLQNNIDWHLFKLETRSYSNDAVKTNFTFY